MRAVVCRNSELRVEDVPEPRPAKGHLVLDVVRAGICGSDLHARFQADTLADAAAAIGFTNLMRVSQAVVMGHEFSGRVRELGPGTKHRVAEGDAVVALPIVRMGGRPEFLGLSEAAPGAYAERVLVDEALTFPVPNGLAPESAALTEPLAVAYHAVRRSKIGKGETAVVVGCGPIGLAVILMLRARGVRHIIASDYSALRRGLAMRCGAHVVVDPGAESPWTSFEHSKKYFTDAGKLLDFAVGSIEKLRAVPFLPWHKVLRAAEAAGKTPRGPVVFECVGVPGIIDHIVQSAPLYTRVIVVGVCMERDAIVPVVALIKEIGLQFVFAYDPGEFHDTLHLLAEGKVDPTPLITSTVDLDGVPGAFDVLGKAEEEAKILVAP
ncbi:zinc-binding dehydrogenase [Sporichthya sp.]|uniref:zinc-binding dehydrogenase n=1 Tax=Sporichthya sp. TaxID=65475 RepID=UPI0017C0494C|nr:zinc-binding dehydrogenase [Sporichthya sp.]MBA3741849.1 zinc-binding dehydrogenase [Sporichthya sp.]